MCNNLEQSTKMCKKVHLKVILETSDLGSLDNIRRASEIVMCSIEAFACARALDIIVSFRLPPFVTTNAGAATGVVPAVERVRGLLVWLDVTPLRGIINNLWVDLVGEGDPCGTGPPARFAQPDQVCAKPWLVRVIHDGERVPGAPSFERLALGEQYLRELPVVVKRVGAAQERLILHEDPPEAGEATDRHGGEL